jgi:hypothetical protein
LRRTPVMQIRSTIPVVRIPSQRWEWNIHFAVERETVPWRGGVSAPAGRGDDPVSVFTRAPREEVLGSASGFA